MAELVPMAIDHLRDGMEIDGELERTDLREGSILRVPSPAHQQNREMPNDIGVSL